MGCYIRADYEKGFYSSLPYFLTSLDPNKNQNLQNFFHTVLIKT